MINKILKLAPIGVFAFICTTVMTFGASALIPLLKLVLVVVFAMVFFIIVVLGIVARICGISIFSIIKILKDELLLAFSTSSSEAVLPVMMKKMEKFGAPRDVTSFVIPIGYHLTLMDQHYTNQLQHYLLHKCMAFIYLYQNKLS